MIAKIMRRGIPGLPNIMFPTVDVRDVAKAHYLALVTPGIQGQRFIINNESLYFMDYANILHEEFKQYGYKVQRRSIPLWTLKLG